MGKVRSGINYDERFAGARELGVMLGFRGLAFGVCTMTMFSWHVPLYCVYMCRRAWFRFGPRMLKTTLRSRTKLQRIFVNKMGASEGKCMGKVRSGINYDERCAGARKLGVVLGFRGLACE